MDKNFVPRLCMNIVYVLQTSVRQDCFKTNQFELRMNHLKRTGENETDDEILPVFPQFL